MSTSEALERYRPTLSDRAAEFRARLAGRLELGLHTTTIRYGLSRDLTLPLTMPKAKIPITVRPLQPQDLDLLFSVEAANNDPVEAREAAMRRSFFAHGAHRAFVAVDERSGRPCYVQWLLGVRDNAFISTLKGFPLLQPGEALLENAYTPAAFRGLGIMSVAMALIAERAADLNARHVFTYVGDDNIPSLKGCQRAGFHPVLLHHCDRLAFGLIRTDRFEPLAEDDPRRILKF